MSQTDIIKRFDQFYWSTDSHKGGYHHESIDHCIFGHLYNSFQFNCLKIIIIELVLFHSVIKFAFLNLYPFHVLINLAINCGYEKKEKKKIISLRSVAKFLTQILLITFPDCLLMTTTTKTVANAAVGDDDNDEYD